MTIAPTSLLGAVAGRLKQGTDHYAGIEFDTTTSAAASCQGSTLQKAIFSVLDITELS